MIPKIVHYIWFGPKPYPKKVCECISSWKKHLPDYKFMLWNETTFDLNSACRFVREAYEERKYAFVSDYVRLWALYKYGGIYMDTDFEVIKPFDSHFFENRLVLGTDEAGYLEALLMAEKGHSFILKCMNRYHNTTFRLDNGKLNMEVINTYLQENLESYGYSIKNERQNLNEGITIYPDDYFNVRSLSSGRLHLTDNSYTIHWHTITWVPLKTRLINFLRIRVIIPIIGLSNYNKIIAPLKKGKTTW